MKTLTKKMKVFIKNLLLISFLFGTIACQPYDDGPSVSFRSKIKRLTGLWEIDVLKINDVDYTGYYKNDSMFVRFSIADFDDDVILTLVPDNRSDEPYARTIMLFDKKYEQCNMNLSVNGTFRDSLAPLFNLVPPLGESSTWNIKRLAYKSFILELSRNDSLFHVEFTNIEKYKTK